MIDVLPIAKLFLHSIFLKPPNLKSIFIIKMKYLKIKLEIKTDSKQMHSEVFLGKGEDHSNLDLIAFATMAKFPGHQMTNCLKLVPHQVNFTGH